MEVMEARLCIDRPLRRSVPDGHFRSTSSACGIWRGASSRRETRTRRNFWDSALHRLIAQAAGNRPLMTMFSLLDEARITQTWRTQIESPLARDAEGHDGEQPRHHRRHRGRQFRGGSRSDAPTSHDADGNLSKAVTKARRAAGHQPNPWKPRTGGMR